jgi:acyl-coenzyme A synthetase/AMP-(fatty) acid ligase/thioesterase domain-containing protein
MIYQIIQRQLELSSNKIALVTSTKERFTYAQLVQRIHQWAHYLLEQGIKPGDRVGVLVDDEDHHVFIYAALDRINASYVPFDKDIPPAQLNIDIATLDLKKLLVEDSLLKQYPIDEGICSVLSQSTLVRIYDLPSEPLELQYESNKEVSYIVSSSGSTGNKKWIPTGAGLLYWADLENKRSHEFPAPKILSTRSPAYDARIYEYVAAFSGANTLYLLPYLQRKDMRSVLTICKDEAINKILLIASQLSLGNTEALIKQLKEYGLTDLMVTGDACTVQLKDLCDTNQLNLWNCYGPTEATFGLSIFRVNNQPIVHLNEQAIVPIGKPDGDEVRYHIIEGKLYIESPYLMRHYFGEADRDKAFIMHDFGDGTTKRLLDTGDAFVEQHGLLYYQGRHGLNAHCKIGGVKVTPAVIEACLNDYKKLNSTLIQVVVVIKSWVNTDRPFAYVVVTEEFDTEDFKAFIKSRLEREKRPLIIKMAQLPYLFPSNKINLRELIARKDLPEEFLFLQQTQPMSLEEELPYFKEVQSIWSDLFNLSAEDLKHEPDFESLAGTSSQLIELTYKINKLLDPNYKYEYLLRLDRISIRNVAKSIDANLKSKLETIRSDQAFIQKLGTHFAGRESLFILPALLGEGYFSYLHLGEIMSKKFDKNVFGLSDPGIFDEAALPASLEHATSRYIAAIKSVQPTGPYELAGFSFGCTLAYEVAKSLLDSKEKIFDLHLLDGFPPYLYQSLTDSVYLELLETLITFMIKTLNNRFYREELSTITLHDLKGLNKHDQLERAFDALGCLVKNAPSKRLLLMAKTHLQFILDAPTPKQKLILWPQFYLTARNQPYLNIINMIPSLSPYSADYKHYFWTHYFSHNTRSGIELECEHLGLLAGRSSSKSETAEKFWGSVADMLYFNIRVDSKGTSKFYRLEQGKLSVFFLREGEAQALTAKLNDLGIQVTATTHDLQYHRGEQRDCIYSVQYTLSGKIPEKAIAPLKLLMKQCIIPEQRANKPSYSYKRIDHQRTTSCSLLHIDVLLTAPDNLYLTLSYAVPAPVFAIAFKKLTPIRQEDDLTYTLESNSIKYHFSMEKPDITLASTFLADFINTVNECLAQLPSVKALPIAQVGTLATGPAVLKTGAAGFFQSTRLERIVNAYKLPDTSQSSLEKALRQAACNNRIDDLRFLMSKVSNIDAQDTNPDSQRTALHWAAIKLHHECYELLLEKADRAIVDAKGQTAVDYYQKQKPVPQAQLKNGTRVPSVLVTATHINILMLQNQYPIAYKEFIKKCKDQSLVISRESQRILEELCLMSKGVVIEEVLNIVLSSVSMLHEELPSENPRVRRGI